MEESQRYSLQNLNKAAVLWVGSVRGRLNQNAGGHGGKSFREGVSGPKIKTELVKVVQRGRLRTKNKDRAGESGSEGASQDQKQRQSW